MRALPGARPALVLAAALSVSMSYGVTLPVLPFLLERALGPAAVAEVSRHTGWLTGIYTVGLLLMSPLWGALSDRWDRRAVMAIGLVGSGASLFLLDATSGLAAIYAARIASGVLSAAVLPAALGYIAETSPQSERPQRLALAASATTLGFLLGPALGSALAPMLIAPASEMRIARLLMLDSPFFLTAAANLLAAGGLWALPAARASEPARASPAASQAQDVIRQARLLTVFVVFGITVAEVGITLFGKLALVLGPRGISFFFVVCSLIMILAQVWAYPRLTRRLGAQRTLTAAFALMTLGLAGMPFAESSAAAGLAFAAAGGGTGVLIPALATQVADAAAGAHGAEFGWQAAAANVGQAIAAASTGVLYAARPSAPFLLAAAVLAAGTLIAART